MAPIETVKPLFSYSAGAELVDGSTVGGGIRGALNNQSWTESPRENL